MAGSINLSLSQQFDKLNGTLLSGGRLYFYAAGTDAPQNAYMDTGLTLVHPNPIILASDGRIPQLYFADGSIHVRLTDSGGVVQFDEDFVLVVGPSDGGGGGGGTSVDPTKIFQTGDILWLPTGVDRSGWVKSNGLTVGNSGSGATRANADCHFLFLYLYGTYDQTTCPVSGGRTGNAENDWTNGKTIATLDFREIMIGGMSEMGNSYRGGYGAVPTERYVSTTPAGIIGEITHPLTIAELAAHDHTGAGVTGDNNRGHTHGGGSLLDQVGGGTIAATAGGVFVVNAVNAGGSGATDDESQSHTHTFSTATVGSGAGHNNTPRTMMGTFYVKL